MAIYIEPEDGLSAHHACPDSVTIRRHVVLMSVGIVLLEIGSVLLQNLSFLDSIYSLHLHQIIHP
jgi:hypothetical protein